jgi:ribosomal protein S18 acetylase RimI-like enzyme
MDIENLRSVPVNPDTEAVFYKYIGDNFAEYFFFHVDYAQYPESTEIYMALDNKDIIHGMLLIWNDRRIQLRGSAKSLEMLLRDKNYSPISITGFDKHKATIEKYFPQYTKEIALYRMAMQKGDFVDFENYPFKILSDSDKDDIASFMRITDPIFWGSRKPEDIMMDENNVFFGIFNNDKLVSITGVWKYKNVGYITIVGTNPAYRNKGYASSIVSSAIKNIFWEKGECLITVRVKNTPAIHTYEKLGFTIQNTQYSYEREMNSFV